MKSTTCKLKRTSAIGVVALMVTLFAWVSVDAQPRPTDGSSVQMGDQRITIPAPQNFEEASSQFKIIKDTFTATEAQGNNMIAVHLPKSECDKLRSGTATEMNFYTKISVREAVRTLDLSPEQFATLIEQFRGSSSQILDFNSPAMKATLARMNRNLSDLRQEETKVDLSQPVNLGEFDTRPNIYSIMLLVRLKANPNDDVGKLIAGSLSYVRVKQRLIYVYAYRLYKSTNDVEILKDFTKQWVGQILAAN